jgi:Bacterial virulence protein (VirJ)
VAAALALLLPVSPARASAPRLLPRNIYIKTEMTGTLIVLLYTPALAKAAARGVPGAILNIPSVTRGKPGTGPEGAAAPTPPGTPPAAPSPSPASTPAPTPGSSFHPAPQEPIPPAVILFSGENGFRPFLQDTASELAARGHTVLGIDSTEYFKKMLSGDLLGKDLETFRTAVNEGAGVRKEAPVILAGFAWGSNMIPYLVNRSGGRGVIGALLLAPDTRGAAVFRVSIRLKMASPPEEVFDVGHELSQLRSMPVVLMQGTLDQQAESSTLLPFLRGPKQLVPIVGGDHQFHEAREAYLDQITAALRWIEAQAGAPRPQTTGIPPTGSN